MSKLFSLKHDSPKRVLVVAYVFPPVGGAGVQRVTKFVKYLPEFGWEATVLTAENPSVPVYDESLLADIPPQTVIVKARTLEPSYALKRTISASCERNPTNSEDAPRSKKSSSYMAVKAFAKKSLRSTANELLQPDPQILWHHHAVEAGLRALSERKHEVIFVTSPPFSSLLIGAELSRRTGLPLVLDYRDEWDISHAYFENKQQSPWSHWVQRRMQHKVIRAASALIATTRHSAEALARVATEAGCSIGKPVTVIDRDALSPLSLTLSPEARARGPGRMTDAARLIITHIYNGFDAADLHVSPEALKPSSPSDTYKLAYVGTLWNLTSVEPLVEAVKLLCQQSPELASRLELQFAGRRTGSQDELLNQLEGLPCRIIRHSYMDHDAAVRLMQSADGLCLLLSDLPHAGRVVPAKLFEYMAVRKPIFAIVPDGEVAELLSDCPLGFVYSPSDVSGLAQRLGEEIERHRLGLAQESQAWDANRFERRQLTGQLGNLFNRVSVNFQPTETIGRIEAIESFGFPKQAEIQREMAMSRSGNSAQVEDLPLSVSQTAVDLTF